MCSRYDGWFKVEVRLYQGLALSTFLFAIIKDRLTDDVRQESPMIFSDDIVTWSERQLEQ